MKRVCGECTQCCKLMGVHDLDPPKPPNVWCKHCDIGVGCRIYQQRPPSCRDFECLWLKDEQGQLSDALRPDRTGVVICVLINGATIVKCDPARPTAWRHPELLPMLHNLARAGYPVGIEAGQRYWIITGTTEWEAPEECKAKLPNGMIAVSCPDDVAAQIGLYIRPECRDLGPVLNPLLDS